MPGRGQLDFLVNCAGLLEEEFGWEKKIWRRKEEEERKGKMNEADFCGGRKKCMYRRETMLFFFFKEYTVLYCQVGVDSFCECEKSDPTCERGTLLLWFSTK